MTNTIAEQKNKSDKAEYINKMFNSIAPKYVLLNMLMTFGQHYKWKEDTVKLALIELSHPANALDICTGTGDIAIILNKYSPSTKITCLDNSTNMIELARTKIKKLNLANTTLETNNFETTDFKRDSVDLVTMGFGLRNLINKEKCLEKIFTLLKTNGVFACIDLGYPSNKLWEKIYFNYFYNIVPRLGTYFAKNKDAYTYLPDSLKDWFKQEELKSLLLKTGFKKCYFKNILGGIVAIHIAIK